jgi:hypothetical protein
MSKSPSVRGGPSVTASTTNRYGGSVSRGCPRIVKNAPCSGEELAGVAVDRAPLACDADSMPSPAESLSAGAGADLPPHVLALVRHDHRAIEPKIDELLDALAHHGAREIWHKHGTFLDHLLGVWRMLVAWRQPTDVCRLGLMHSIYSNSFVRMKVFDAERPEGRATVRHLIGDEAERLVHLFCVIRREELLPFGELGVPTDGIEVGLNTGAGTVRLSRRDLGIFLIVTMADYAEQLFSWQDHLFGMTGRGGARTLWPGDNRPGLWMALNARFGRRAAACGVDPLPPVFAGCTADIERAAETEARDRYWQVISASDGAPARAEELLQSAAALNPFVAEPLVLLAQTHLTHERWADAEHAARRALTMLAEWATPWDKRLSWEAWVAWTRVLLKAARERAWPTDAPGVISLGEVRPGL